MSAQQTIRQILDLAYRLEKDFSRKCLEEDLPELKRLISQLGAYEDPLLNRLSEIERHLSLEMNLKHFVGFIVPFERWLNRSLQDDDFLISTGDNSNLVQRAPLAVVLDNIRSAFNVGSILRSLEAFGGVECYFCGYTPTPESDKVIKTAMGTIDCISWRYALHLDQAISELKSDGYQIIGLETAQNSQPLYQTQLPKKCAILVGNERFGLDINSLKLCDQVVHIPLYGSKNSLNVSIATGIALNEWRRQWSLQ